MRRTDVRRDGQINKSAFMPRSNGKDRDGLSVSIFDQEFHDVHRAKYDQPAKAVACIVVLEILRIGLKVNADPDEEDPRHALIVGIPDRTLGDQERLEAERLAEQLAKRATLFHFSPPADHDASL
jgi:hypothetical protein